MCHFKATQHCMCGQDHSSNTVSINYIWSGTTFDLKPPHVKKERNVNVVRVEEKSFTSVKPTPQFIFEVPCGDSNTITIVHRDENVHLSRHLDCQTSWAVAMDNHKKKKNPSVQLSRRKRSPCIIQIWNFMCVCRSLQKADENVAQDTRYLTCSLTG